MLQNRVLILKMAGESHFSHCFFQTGLATTILAIIFFDWDLHDSFQPLFFSIGTCDNHFSRFQNQLDKK